jgi:hypothetical protein
MNTYLTLNSGYYRVAFKLYNNEGLSIERREILHIYQNMESAFTCTFKDDQFVNDTIVTSNADSGVGSLRQALADAPDGSTIVIDSSVGTIALNSRLAINNKDLIIEGNGVTITRSGSWTTNDGSQLLFIDRRTVTIRRVHFKDDGTTNSGVTVHQSESNLTLESCIFSGNQNSDGYGGAIYSFGWTIVKGCTFYGNYSGGNGGAIYQYYGSLTLEGNLFYRNTASYYPVVYPSFTSISNAYNVVDVPLGTGSNQSGFTAATGDTTISSLPVSPLTFRLFSDSGAAGVITSLSADYPEFDFYGNPITAPAAAGAVQAFASGTAGQQHLLTK